MVRKDPARMARQAEHEADSPEDGGEHAEHQRAVQTSGGGRGNGEEPAEPQESRRRV